MKGASKEYQAVGAQPHLETTNGVLQDGSVQVWPLVAIGVMGHVVQLIEKQGT